MLFRPTQEKKAAETAREKELEEAKDEKRRLMEAQRYIRVCVCVCA